MSNPSKGPSSSRWARVRGLNWPTIIVVTCGVLLVLLGAVVMFGWHTGRIVLLRLYPGYALMQYLTALGILLSGLSLLFHAGKKRWLGVAFGALPMLGGSAFWWEDFSSLHTWSVWILAHLPSSTAHPAMIPSPPTILCLIFCGLALVTIGLPLPPRGKRPLLWTISAFILAFSSMAIVGYMIGITATYAWGRFTGMALHTATGFFLLSIGILATQWSREPGEARLRHRWLPVPVGIFSAAVTLILWQALLADQRATLVHNTELAAQTFGAEISGQLDTRLHDIRRLAERWNQPGGPPATDWLSDAASDLDDNPLLDAIAWVDSSGRMSRTVSRTPHASLEGINLAEDHHWPWTTLRVGTPLAHAPSLSPVFSPTQDHLAFLVAFPLYPRGVFDGFLIAVFQEASFLDFVVAKTYVKNYRASITDNGTPIYGPVRRFGLVRPVVSADVAVPLLGRIWQVNLAPTPTFVRDSSNNLPNLLLIFGCALTIALVLTVSVLQEIRQQSVATEAANLQLEQEVIERRQIEGRLRESEERLRAVLDGATGVSVIAGDLQGMITFYSKGAEKLLGYKAEEVVGVAAAPLIHDPEEIAARAEELSRELGYKVEGFATFTTIPLRQGSERREWTYVCKDGARRTVDLTVSPVHDAENKVIGFLGTAIDITDRQRMALALRETALKERAARFLLETAGRIGRLGHWEIPLGKSSIWSEITCEILGVPHGTVWPPGQGINFYAPEDRDFVRECMQRTVETGEPFDFERRITNGKGQHLWIHALGEAVRDEQGHTTGVRGIFQDVTERHKAAELLNERNRQLEAATAAAESHARAKAEFLANMSHEIRTPLNAIIGMSELLQDITTEKRQREFVDTIRMSGDSLLGLINDILDFSKIEAGQLDLEHIPVDLQECVESTLDLVTSQAAHKELDLLYWIDPGVPPVILGDLTRLRQVLVNLATNAVKFTERGEVFVRISKREGLDGDLLHVSVRDTGIGIAPDRQNRLFSAFSQVDASTSRRYGGTGLGLAICRRIIEIMRGRIWVDSELGKGADFQFEIPLAAASTVAPTVYQRGAREDLGGLRLLLVDDNATNRWILETQAETWGMQTRATPFPAEALSWIERGDPFDLAILDAEMPGMDGYALAEKLRRHQTQRKLPIIILTSKSDHSSVRQNASVTEILTKPVKRSALLDIIKRILLGEHTRRDTDIPREAAPNLGVECPLKILVAEDNPVNQRVITLLLERLGYRIEIAANGLEVIAALHRSKFDVVLLDVQMPEMDGLQAAREICHLFPAAERPLLIALTADAGEGDREECLNAGMDNYLSKPVRSNLLADTLRAAYESRTVKV